ncbi:MAG: glycine cleavage system protein GcvH [Candidatus Lokiarchaeota archaeon]|nr:glycine cleavage system protein GcvH [Candidatus Lokiarchaeota archaeon]
MNVPDDLKYTKSHEWVKITDGIAVMGITDHAQHELTDIVYVDDFPEIGSTVEKGKTIAIIESVKAVADVYAAVSGELLEVNADLENSPELLNKAPYEAWLAKVRVSKPGEIDALLSAAAYKASLSE